MAKVVVLILSTSLPGYGNFVSAVRGGWVRQFKEADIPCYFYSGGWGNIATIGDEMRLVAPDDLGHTAGKLKQALQLALQMHPDVDLVYRTNLSSYVDVKNFLKFVEQHSLNAKSYCGVIGRSRLFRERFFRYKPLYAALSALPVGQRIAFASGSGFFLGADWAARLSRSSGYDHLVDDVMVAASLGQSPDPSKIPARFDIQANGGHKIPKAQFNELRRDRLLFHYRLKTRDRTEDARVLKAFADEDYRYAYCTK